MSKKQQKEEDILVHCPKCKTNFMRPPSEIEGGERCGVCVKDVVMVEGHYKEKTKTKRKK